MRVHALVGFAFLGCLAGLSSEGEAQAGPSVTVRGVAYDSLNAVPLRGALLNLGASQTAISDDSGRFRFDGVAPGAYTLVMQHDRLDSLGIAAVRREFTASEGAAAVRIAIPSFDTFWRRSCGGQRAPQDSGFVFGTLRDAGARSPIGGAVLYATWSEIGFDRASGVSQSRMGGLVNADAAGNYVVCGVPTGVMLELRVSADAHATLLVELPFAAPGVVRQDLFLRAHADSMARGAVRGVVRGLEGEPVARASVGREGSAPVLTDDAGRFLIAGLPIGTTALDVRSIGSAPFTALVHITAGDTANIVLPLRKLSVLAEVRVSATSIVVQRFVSELEDRRALGIAKMVDSSAIERRGTIVGALANVANVKVSNRGDVTLGLANGSACRPAVFVDRREVQSADVQAELRMLNVTEIGVIEVYPRRIAIPPEFWGRQGMPDCAIAIWTKRMFR